MSTCAPAGRRSSIVSHWSGFHACGHRAAIENLLRRHGCEQMHGAGYETRPAGLMAGTQTGPIVTVEIFVEQEMVAPVRIVLELLGRSIYRPSAIAITQKDAAEPGRDVLRDLI